MKKIMYLAMVVAVYLLCTSFIFPMYCGNYTWLVFSDTTNTTTTTTPTLKMSSSGTNTLDTYLNQGAGYLMKGYSNTLLCLGKQELSEGTLTDLKTNVSNAVYFIEKAKTAYYNLYYTAVKMDYNPNVITKLQGFDYWGFGIRNSLDSTILNDVSNYLEYGDVVGLYYIMYKNTSNILNNLYKMRDSFNAGTMPDSNIVFSVNQRFSYTLMFGQYATMIFLNL